MNLKILLKLSALPNKNPQIKLTVTPGNHTQLLCGAGDVISEFNLPVGRYRVTIELLNKNPSDTIVNADGQIEADLNCVIEKIIINSVEILDINSITLTDNKTNGWVVNKDPYEVFVMIPGRYLQSRLDVFSNNLLLLTEGI